MKDMQKKSVQTVSEDYMKLGNSTWNYRPWDNEIDALDVIINLS